jgi:hypothetical protein
MITKKQFLSGKKFTDTFGDIYFIDNEIYLYRQGRDYEEIGEGNHTNVVGIVVNITDEYFALSVTTIPNDLIEVKIYFKDLNLLTP